MLGRLDWFIYQGLPPNPLLVLEAIAKKQLPVELVTMIRDHVANWAMVKIVVSDYDFDLSIAEPLILDLRENFKEYAIFYQQLLRHDWFKPIYLMIKAST